MIATTPEKLHRGNCEPGSSGAPKRTRGNADELVSPSCSLVELHHCAPVVMHDHFDVIATAEAMNDPSAHGQFHRLLTVQTEYQSEQHNKVHVSTIAGGEILSCQLKSNATVAILISTLHMHSTFRRMFAISDTGQILHPDQYAFTPSSSVAFIQETCVEVFCANCFLPVLEKQECVPSHIFYEASHRQNT